ncbi:hypothetical protein B0H17DRAFT_1197760 [Mycena rosella]|uniref:Uncharacterized protein n=1 Tax=Mycena rosella TaxID=1033263 RepID=A0AAD7DS70_MYCRO|nr:hypothetical protein B0H17DRAFT_1197760 [Mycena rosella]
MTMVVVSATIGWLFCHTSAVFITVSVIYGFTVGGFSAIGFVTVAAMGRTEDLDRRIGTLNTVLGLGLLYSDMAGIVPTVESHIFAGSTGV